MAQLMEKMVIAGIAWLTRWSGLVHVFLTRSQSPDACQHIQDAISTGQPSTLTKDSGSKSVVRARRRASTGGYPTVPGMQRDEYPPAMSAEGGAGASVRSIPDWDNGAAGSNLGHLLNPYPQGTNFTIQCV